MKKILINVVAYNRPNSLKRLLDSIEFCSFEENVNLSIDIRISIDYSGNDECLKIANNFNWKHGSLFVVQNQQNFGLKKHIIHVCNNSLEYDFFVVLEDDLIISPYFFIFIVKLVFEEIEIISDKNLAQISLYNPRISESLGLCWEPIQDGYQNYYLQTPSSWGQFYLRDHWIDFIKFYQNFDYDFSIQLPEHVRNWPSKSSWKKIFFQYILENNKFVFYPRFSLTSNIGDKGTHFHREVFDYRSSLLCSMNFGLKLNFSKFDESTAIYNANLDLLKGNLVSQLAVDDLYLNYFEIDENLVHFPFDSVRFLASNGQNKYGNFNSKSIIYYYSKFFDPRNKLRDFYIAEFIGNSKFLSFLNKFKNLLKFFYTIIWIF